MKARDSCTCPVLSPSVKAIIGHQFLREAFHVPQSDLTMQGTGKPGKPMYYSMRSFLRDAWLNSALLVPAGLYCVNNWLKFMMQLYFNPTTAKMLGNLKVSLQTALRALLSEIATLSDRAPHRYILHIIYHISYIIYHYHMLSYIIIYVFCYFYTHKHAWSRLSRS